MFCINCGKQLEEGSRFCPYCGAKVPDVSAGPSGEYGYSASQSDGGAGDPSVNANAYNPFQPQNPAGPDQGQAGAGYWNQSGPGNPGPTAAGYQNQTGPGPGPQNSGKAGFDPWAMKGGPAQTGAGPRDDPWGVRGGAAATAVAPKKKKHTVRNVILIVLGVIVLALVGLYILGSTGAGNETYKPVIESYLDYAEDADVQRVESLFYPDVLESYGILSSQADGSDMLFYLDSWTSNYGLPVDRYEIAEVDQEEDELRYFNDSYGANATEYVDVTVNVFYDNGRYDCMDFEMICVDDSWYLVYIW